MLSDARFAVTGGDYLANLSMVPHWFGIPYVDGAYWSLGYELHFYILVLVVIGLGWMKQLEWLLAGWLLVSAINAVRPMWPVEFWLNAKWAPFFAAGGVFYLVRTLGLTLRRLLLLAAAFALAQFYAIYRAPAAGSGSPLVVAAFITAIFVVFSLVAARRFQMKGSAWIYYAGALTYPLYVIHQNLGFMVYARLLALLDSVNAALALMLVLLLGLSWCVHAYVEAPLSPRLRRWLAKPRAAGSERAA
jgi:peptidoglycan/LPS O-acetylase OafA/YrhL